MQQFWQQSAAWVALTFLTRFGTAQVVDTPSIVRSVRWYGPVGLVLGCLCTAPLWLAAWCGLWHSAALTAWLYVLLGVWCTRGMHWDGLADLGDALGSGAQGDAFWRVMHDSRLGAFGALTMLLAALGLWLAATAQVEAHRWWPLVFAPVYGRCGAVFLAAWVPAYNAASLGGTMRDGATAAVTVEHALLALAAVVFAGGRVVLPLAAGFCMLWYLQRTARHHGGVNGDMLGASIITHELLFLLTV